MPDANKLVRAIKKAAREAWEASKPVNVFFGEVKSVNPLKINVEQKMILGKAQLVLARNVTEHKVSITAGNIKDYYYKGSAPDKETLPVSPSHVHAVGEMEITIHNDLKVGDEVILIRQQEGQKFVVIDRIGGEI